MSSLTAENILTLIEQLPPSEQARLRQLMDERQRVQPQPESLPAGPENHQPKEPPPEKPLRPIRPMPDSTREMRWIATHQREYVGQWVALDGDRLIAASPNHEEVTAAAEADGAGLPLFAYIDDPDKIYAGF